MGPHLATNWLGLELYFTEVLPQGQVKFMSRSFEAKVATILNKKDLLQFPYVFVAKKCSTRLQLTQFGREAFQHES